MAARSPECTCERATLADRLPEACRPGSYTYQTLIEHCDMFVNRHNPGRGIAKCMSIAMLIYGLVEPVEPPALYKYTPKDMHAKLATIAEMGRIEEEYDMHARDIVVPRLIRSEEDAAAAAAAEKVATAKKRVASEGKKTGAAVEMVRLKPGDLMLVVWVSEYDQCAICLDDLTSYYELACGHRFHYYCALRAREQKESCPLCRADKHGNASKPVSDSQDEDEDAVLRERMTNARAANLRLLGGLMFGQSMAHPPRPSIGRPSEAIQHLAYAIAVRMTQQLREESSGGGSADA